MEIIKQKLRSILLVMICSAFSFTLFMLPNAQGAESALSAITTFENPCGDQGVKEVVMGKSRIIGCWGNGDVCKVKCYKPQAE